MIDRPERTAPTVSPRNPGNAWSSGDRWAILGLVLVGIIGPLLIGAISGALFIPHNDDFNYRRVALGLFETGQVQLTGWTVMSLVGQLAYVQPFLWVAGGASWAFGVSTAVLAVLGIAASYHLVRRFLPTSGAVFAVATLLFFPGFLLNTTSFMTDVPALAGEALCLALGASALDRRGSARTRWLVASLVIGCFAFSIREFAIAAPVAVLIAATASDFANFRRYVIGGITVLAACGAVYLITSNLPGQGTASMNPLASANIDAARHAVATLAFVLAPALTLATARWHSRLHAPEVVAGAAIAVLMFRDEIGDTLGGAVPSLLVGNIFVKEGSPGSGALAGFRPPPFESPGWEAINIVALAGTIVGVGLLGGLLGLGVRSLRSTGWSRVSRSLGSPLGLLLTFSSVFATGVLAFGLVASMFDRYLWPLALTMSAALLVRPAAPAPTRTGQPAGVVAAVLMVGLAAASTTLLLNSDAFDAARWHMGEVAASRGIPRETVDAGMEWVGYHATGLASVGAVPDQGEMWYDAWWPSFRLCAMVSSSPLDVAGFQLEAADVEAYRLILFAGPQEPLYLYRVSGPDCRR